MLEVPILFGLVSRSFLKFVFDSKLGHLGLLLPEYRMEEIANNVTSQKQIFFLYGFRGRTLLFLGGPWDQFP